MRDQPMSGRGPVRYTAVRRLDAIYAAKRGWHSNRSCAIRTLMDWPDARCRTHRRTCAGSAGIHAMLPGIVRYASQRAIAHAAPAKFRNGGFANGDCTGLAQTLNMRMIEIRNAIAVDMRARHGAHPTRKGQILDARRYAVKNA